MKRKLRDPLLYVGIAYLILLILFAAFGPTVRDGQMQSALASPKVSSVFSVVGQPNLPAGTPIGAVESLWLRGDPTGAVVTAVEPDTTAHNAGIRLGATITDVDGVKLAGKKFPEVQNLLAKSATVKVTFELKGETKTVDWVRTSLPEPPRSTSLTLGSDEQGRDVLARVAQGARISLEVGLLVQVIALVLGVSIGVLGVFAPKWLSMALMRFTDGMFAFPDILLAILIIGVYQKPGLWPVIIALSITSWPSVTRLVRAQTATLKDREFVVAARASGASTFYQVTRHILPQLAGILLSISMIEVAGTILAESTLSFLGIGVQPPDPSWGAMINNARSDMNSHPILLLWPCLVLSLTIFALNFVGDGITAWLDPKNN